MPIPTLTAEILGVLSKARYGMNANAIYARCTLSDDPNTLKTMLCALVSRGYVYRDGKTTCPTCNCTAVCYRITEVGRVRLHELVG